VRFTSALKRIFDPHVCVIETNDAVNYLPRRARGSKCKDSGFSLRVVVQACLGVAEAGAIHPVGF
jgi:hypothetical protein